MSNSIQRDSNGHSHKNCPTEFGGVFGVLLLVVWSHYIIFYFWHCLNYNDGQLIIPYSFQSFRELLGNIVGNILEDAMPTYDTWLVYILFTLLLLTLAAVLPGYIYMGLPLPADAVSHIDRRKQLPYVCNAYLSWLIMLALIITLQYKYSHVFDISHWIMTNYGKLMTTTIIFGDLFSIFLYSVSALTGNSYRNTGSPIYDIFMGGCLNPRIQIGGLKSHNSTYFFEIDLKIFAEARNSWILLFIINFSAFNEQFLHWNETHDLSINSIIDFTSSSPALFLLVAQWLYCNAIMKGEECITTTWDVFHEKFGWMLIFWNVAGVPFLYSLQPMYLYSYYKRTGDLLLHDGYFLLFLYLFVFCVYYIWDTANSQKNFFRMQRIGSYRPRATFPQLPWRILDPKTVRFITTSAGSELLIDGWWRYARKIHYTTDICMALCWGMACGFDSYVPYFYVLFFASFLTHRTIRDHERCSKKYGNDWKVYCKTVPYSFVPFIV